MIEPPVKSQCVTPWAWPSVEACSRRDPKGLYSLNQTGQVQLLSGRDSTFEPPAQGDAALVIDTERADVTECADQLFRAVGKSFG